VFTLSGKSGPQDAPTLRHTVKADVSWRLARRVMKEHGPEVSAALDEMREMNRWFGVVCGAFKESVGLGTRPFPRLLNHEVTRHCRSREGAGSSS
jgi:hypothetical protein